ncbi:hypothetical protein BDV06DRAFT_201615 [Aspergillus oleicola]
MAGPPTSASRLNRILTHWPKDPIRPSSVSVQTYLQSRISQSQPSPSSQSQTSPAGGGQLSESSINALASLLDNRYAEKYPLSPRIRHPASNPSHYDDLIREFAEAPERDFFGRIFKRLGGLFRLQ